MSKAVGALLATLVLGFARQAPADGPPATSPPRNPAVFAASSDGAAATSLSWVRLPGAESCVDVRALAAAVERRLGRPSVATPVLARRTIEGRIEPAGASGGYRASFAITGESGEILGTREIAGASPSCRAMDEDLALVVALMIDPDAAMASPAPIAPANLPGPPTPTWTPPPRPPASLAPAAPNRQLHAALSAGGALSVGQLPSAGAGVAMRLWLDPPVGIPFEAAGVFWTPQRISSPDGGFGADVWAVLGEIAACPLTGLVRGFAWAGCAGISAGMAHVGGFGLDVTLAHDVGQLGLSVRGEVRRALGGPFFAALGAGLSVPLIRLDLSYDAAGGTREVFSAPPLFGTGDLALGVELR